MASDSGSVSTSQSSLLTSSDSNGTNDSLAVEFFTGFRTNSELVYHTAEKMIYTKHNTYKSRTTYRCYSYRDGCTAKLAVGMTMRTTCSVEAYNGVLGKKICGQSTFFKFVESIRFEADAKSLELKGYKDSGGELRSDRKKRNKVSYYL